ncbi:MAG: 3-dehydroquinate synthase [Planctomycetota bacterium]
MDENVYLEFAHRVRFTRGVFAPSNPMLRDVLVCKAPSSRPKLLAVVDQGLVEARPELQREIESYFGKYADLLPELVGFRALPGGEVIKNDLSLLEGLLGDLNRLGIDRRSYVMAIGGGALLDTVGFAASVTHRGVRLIRLPTTTLAQADSGVGVKNGVNMFGKKNFIGSFAVPQAVVNDLDFLETLSDRDWRCGLAEAVKVALLKDAGFYESIAKLRSRLVQRDAGAADTVWQRSAELHLQHICRSPEDGGGGDPFESKSARPLDLGHWAAHQLESLSHYELRHGEAVAIGLALDTLYATHVGLLDPAVGQHIHQLLRGLGFALTHPALQHPGLLEGIEAFREHLGGNLTITLPRGVGDPVEVHEIDLALMNRCAQELSHAPTGSTISAG